MRAAGEGVPVVVNRHRAAELVALIRVVTLDVGAGGPLPRRAREQIERARLFSLVLALAPRVEDVLDEELPQVRRTDAASRAVLEIGSDHQRIAVAAQRQPGSERAVRSRIGRLDERLLAPSRAV